MIISFSGVDCAGKSTQIKALENYFISKGKTCKVFWYRPGYSQEMQLCKNAIRKAATACLWVAERAPKMLATRKTASDKGVYEVSGTVSGKPSSDLRVPAPIWLTTAFFDTMLQWGLKLRLYERRYDVVICDRYVEDARLDLFFKYPQYRFTDDVMDRIEKLLPEPDHSIMLWLPFDEMLRRAASKDEPFPDSEEIREKRYRAYDKLSTMTRIDTSATLEETFAKILAALGEPVTGA